MEFSKLQAPSLKELFVNQIESKILSGELPIGSRLPTERELASAMGISRTVVNAGIVEMETKGFLQVIPRTGVFVADYRRNGTSEILVSILKYNGGNFSKDDIQSFLEFKEIIDKYCITNAIDKITETEADELWGYIDTLNKTGDIHESALAAFNFNREISFISGNSLTSIIYNSFKNAEVALWEMYIKKYGVTPIYDYWCNLLRHMLNKDLNSAIKCLEEHMKDTLDGEMSIFA